MAKRYGKKKKKDKKKKDRIGDIFDIKVKKTTDKKMEEDL